MAVVTARQLLESGVHFGHQTRRWNPKMKRFILTERNGIYIIDLHQSLTYIDQAYAFIKDIVGKGGQVLFVGTKKQAQEAVAEQATRVGMPYVNQRWLGGMLTNFHTMVKRIQKLKELESMDFDDVAASGLTKKELLGLRREKDKLSKTLGGIRDMNRVPEAVWIVDREVLLLGVDDPDGLRDAGHVTDAAEGLGELVLLATQAQELLLRQAGGRDVVEVHRLQFLQLLDPLHHGVEVREHAAQPTLVHVGHPDTGRLLGDGLLRLLLGADEENLATLAHDVLDEGVRLIDVGQRLVQVDDVDAVALGEDEPLHLGVPATGLVSEVDAALEELAGGNNGHGRVLSVRAGILPRREVSPAPSHSVPPDADVRPRPASRDPETVTHTLM